MAKAVFDTRLSGIGDGVIASWIAQGAINEGHDVKFTSGYLDPVYKAFGLPTTTEHGILFAGAAKSYQHEMNMRGTRPQRAFIWQLECPFRVTPARPRATLDAEEIAWAKDIADGQSAQGQKRLVLLFPYANYGARTWPKAKWLNMAWALKDAGIATVALHMNKESVEQFPFFVYGFSIRQIMALMQQASLVVANDSGSAHLAGTLGVRTLALMGPTDPNVVFGHTPEVTPMAVSKQELPCVGCHFEKEVYRVGCDSGCEALNLLPYRRVLDRVKLMLDDKIYSVAA